MLFGEQFEALRVRTAQTEINLVHGGSGPPLLLLHGYPQTHLMWREVAPRLATRFHVICPDLRGYGDSGKPASTADHAPYSKRAMAQDMIEVMSALGHERFAVAGHDRGARVTHRMLLDHPERISRACVLDIAPTHYVFAHTDQQLATGYYHWFFLIQPNNLPEHLIGADPGWYLRTTMKSWGRIKSATADAAMAEYLRCFSQPEMIHAACEDYRAAASIDLIHDEADRARRIECPLLVLWGSQGLVGRLYDVPAVWREYANQVEGHALDAGHFLAEEAPDATFEAMSAFF